MYITAGEFDPWRTPSPSLWLDDLQKMKADGYNAVTVYFDWDYSSPSPGVYDFTGVRDMNLFLNMAQQAGLYVIARPGPYINAETDAGGIASWALPSPTGYRTDARPFESAELQWISEIDSIIAAHQITKGGDVIAYQIENEYTGRSAADLQYLANLEQQAHSDGIDVPFTFNQCCGGPFYTSGTGAVNISGPDNYPLGFNCADTSHFGQPYGYPTQAGEPLYLPEFQGGSFDGWGGSGYDNCYTMTGPGFENVYYKNNIAQGATMQSYYMGVGGTNWGWLPAPLVYTSYDYGAAIRETGEIGTPANPNDITGSKFGENKLINDFETSVRAADQDHAGGPARAGQRGGHHHGPRQPRQRHPVHLRAPGRRHLDRHGEHAPGAERGPVDRLHLRRRRPGAHLHRHLDPRRAERRLHERRLGQHRVVEHAGRGQHDGDLHRHGGAVDRPEEHQRRHRRPSTSTAPRSPRGHLRVRPASSSSRSCSRRPG